VKFYWLGDMHSEGVHKVHYSCRDGVASTMTSSVFTEERTETKWQNTHDLLVKGPKVAPLSFIYFFILLQRASENPGDLPNTHALLNAMWYRCLLLLHSTFLSQKPLMRPWWRRSRTRTSRWGEGHRRSCSNGPDGGYGTR
jgi:hypothetical protein